MLEAWQFNVILAEFSVEATGLYERAEGMKELPPVAGLRGYLRPNLADLLPPKGHFWQKMTPFLRIADQLLALPTGLRLRFFRLPKPRIRFLKRIDEAAAAFISTHQTGEFSRRDADWLNWMLDHSWVLETNRPDDFSSRYYFTSTAREFQFLLLEIQKESGEMVGLAALHLRNGHLRIPFAWFAGGQTKAVGQAILSEAIRMKANMLTVFNPRLVAFFHENRTPFFWKRTQNRRFFIGKGLADFFENRPFLMQDGEGDLGFT